MPRRARLRAIGSLGLRGEGYAFQQMIEIGPMFERHEVLGVVEPDRIVELLEAGAEPLRDLIAAMHSKLLLAELQRHRDTRA